MRPLYPVKFSGPEAVSFKWAERPENKAFYHHLINVCQDFPSVLMAYSADSGAAETAAELSHSIIDSGINVFLPSEPVPICAFSQSIGARQVPIGLYLSAASETGSFTLAALTNHGGPIDEQDVLEAEPKKNDRSGVMGTTEYDRIYLNNLAGFADQFIEDGPGFKDLKIPFPTLEEKMKEIPELKILFERDPDGPEATISPDGQGIIIRQSSGKIITSEVLSEMIAKYLVKERHAAGSIVGPAGKVKPADINGEVVEVDGNLFDMNYQAGFSDLLIGWWQDGVIAHQGSSCFGDGILTALYYLEALRS
jgi:hypothetical protein